MTEIAKFNEPIANRCDVGRWQSRDACAICLSILSDDELMYSSGVCPYCGHSSGASICDHTKIIFRRVYTFIPTLSQRLFEGLTSKYIIEPKDEFTYKVLGHNHYRG